MMLRLHDIAVEPAAWWNDTDGDKNKIQKKYSK
jgi:hypothetical protein